MCNAVESGTAVTGRRSQLGSSQTEMRCSLTVADFPCWWMSDNQCLVFLAVDKKKKEVLMSSWELYSVLLGQHGNSWKNLKEGHLVLFLRLTHSLRIRKMHNLTPCCVCKSGRSGDFKPPVQSSQTWWCFSIIRSPKHIQKFCCWSWSLSGRYTFPYNQSWVFHVSKVISSEDWWLFGDLSIDWAIL